MSPTIIRERGFRIVIFFNDHAPAHVHAIKDDGMARFGLEPVEVLDNYGLKKKDLKRARQIIEENQALLLENWNLIHGE